MQKINGQNVHIIVPDEMLSEIDRIAKRQGFTRSETIRTLVECGSEIYRDFEKIGVVRMSEIMKRAKKTILQNVGQQKLFE